MKCLERNKQPFKYANLTGLTKIMKDGYETGEYTLGYSTPVSCMGNISRETGSDVSDQFGINLNYSKTIVLDDPNFPIEESSVLWIDNLSGDYDYIVKRISRSLNSVSILAEKAQVNG